MEEYLPHSGGAPSTLVGQCARRRADEECACSVEVEGKEREEDGGREQREADWNL